jgi:hypothetical protein
LTNWVRNGADYLSNTLLNTPGFEQVITIDSYYFDFEEITLNIKNEGETITHRVIRNGSIYKPIQPTGMSLQNSLQAGPGMA